MWLILTQLFFVSSVNSFPREDDQPYSYWLSGSGISASCDYAVFTALDYQQLFLWNPPAGKIPLIYIHVGFVKQLSRTINHFPYAFVLLSGHGDTTNPSEIFDSDRDFHAFVDSKNIVHWFSQNCIVLDHPKISPMPVGLNYHTLTTVKDSYWGSLSTPLEQELEFNIVRSAARPFQQRIPKIYGNFHFTDYFWTKSKFGYTRQDVIQAIPAACIDYEPTRIKRHDGWLHQTDYAFVVSPHGNGLDCHRTWEALILGCVVIVKTSPLDILYQDLPVVIVQDWKEITEEWLHRVFTEYSGYDMDMGESIGVGESAGAGGAAGTGIRAVTRTKGYGGVTRGDPLLLAGPSSPSRQEGITTKKTWLERLEIDHVFKGIFNRLASSLSGYSYVNPSEHGHDGEREGYKNDKSVDPKSQDIGGSMGDKHDHMGQPGDDRVAVVGKKRNTSTRQFTESTESTGGKKGKEGKEGKDGKEGNTIGRSKRRKWAYEKLTLAYWVDLFHSKAGVAHYL